MCIRDRFRRLAVDEHCVTFVKFAERVRAGVKAQRQIFRIGLKSREKEGVATDISRDINGVEQLALVIDERVHAFVQTLSLIHI